MLRLTVLGGTGGTGLEVIQQALKKGHEVTALVRSEDKLKHLTHSNLHVIKADVFDPETFHQHLENKDGVISCLGYTESMFPKQPFTFYTETMKSIMEAMRRARATRLVCMTTWCTTDSSSHPFVVEWIIKPLFLSRFTKNVAEMEAMLENSEDINYTVVKPAQLTNSVDGGESVKTAVGQFVPYTFREGFMGKAFLISRAKVARFILESLDTKEFDRKLVSIR